MSSKNSKPGSTKKKNNSDKEHKQESETDTTMSAPTFKEQPDTSLDTEHDVVQLLQQQLQQQQEQMLKQQELIDQLLKKSQVKQDSQPANQQQLPVWPHTHSIQQLRPELYGIPQQSSLGEAPKYTIGNRFATWKQEIEAFVGSHGLDPLVNKPPNQSWNDAVMLKPANVPLSTLQQWYVQASKRVVYAISLASIKAGLDRDQLLADARVDKPDNGVVTVGSLRIDVEANPYLIMQTLRERYDTKTPYAAISIWRKLLESRWDRNKDKGSKFLQTARDMFTQLDQLVADDRPKAGECFGETMKAIILLNMLPSSLATDVKILTTQDKITVAQVESLVRKYDDLQPGAAKSDKLTDKANALVQDKQQSK